MASSRYRKLLKLCESWPVDATKAGGGRDLGFHIRERVATGFKQGDATRIDPVECDRIHDSLQRLATDHHRSKHPRTLSSSTASGMAVEDLRLATSTDGMKDLQKDLSFLEKIKMAFGRY